MGLGEVGAGIAIGLVIGFMLNTLWNSGNLFPTPYGAGGARPAGPVRRMV